MTLIEPSGFASNQSAVAEPSSAEFETGESFLQDAVEMTEEVEATLEYGRWASKTSTSEDVARGVAASASSVSSAALIAYVETLHTSSARDEAAVRALALTQRYLWRDTVSVALATARAFEASSRKDRPQTDRSHTVGSAPAGLDVPPHRTCRTCGPCRS